uniref:P0 n=1 Tax=Bitter apple aphid-born yellows virus TaxID=3077960 RepID=A0AA96HDD9_9VIRU|nr:P0 [Bitter apple aphid-born yellows virus]
MLFSFDSDSTVHVFPARFESLRERIYSFGTVLQTSFAATLLRSSYIFENYNYEYAVRCLLFLFPIALRSDIARVGHRTLSAPERGFQRLILWAAQCGVLLRTSTSAEGRRDFSLAPLNPGRNRDHMRLFISNHLPEIIGKHPRRWEETVVGGLPAIQRFLHQYLQFVQTNCEQRLCVDDRLDNLLVDLHTLGRRLVRLSIRENIFSTRLNNSIFNSLHCVYGEMLKSPLWADGPLPTRSTEHYKMDLFSALWNADSIPEHECEED